MKYTTVSSLKEKLWIATNDSDSELSSIIDEATQLIDNEIWFNLEKRNVTERVDGMGNNRIYLKNKPNMVSIVTGESSFYDVDFIEWYIVYLKQNTSKWTRNITVEYEVWFDTPPKDIESICLDICVVLSDKYGIKWSNSIKLIDKNIQTQKLWGLSITYFGETEKKKNAFEKLDPGSQIQKVLNKYKPFTWLH